MKSEGTLLLDARHWETSPRFPGQKLERIKEPSLSGCDTDAGFPYQAGQKSTRSGLAASVPSGASQRRSWAPLPHCQLKRPSVRLTQDGGGGARQALIKVMNCKIERDRDDRRACSETNFTLHPLPPVIVNVCLCCEPQTEVKPFSHMFETPLVDSQWGLACCSPTASFNIAPLSWQWKKLGWQLKQLQVIGINKLKTVLLITSLWGRIWLQTVIAALWVTGMMDNWNGGLWHGI